MTRGFKGAMISLVRRCTTEDKIAEDILTAIERRNAAVGIEV